MLAAAAALFATGSALAIVQPGDIGDDESAAPAATTTSTTSPSTTTTEAALTTTTTVVVTTTTAAPGSTSTTSGGGETSSTTTTVAGSGLGEGSAPNGGSRGVANTGGESMIGAGMAVAALGLLLRRAVRPEAA